MVLCRFLLDTAAASNLSSVHVVGLTANGTHLYHSISTIQKLMVLQYALEGPDPSSGMRPWADISPSDVVMVIDATDTMSQLTSEEFLQRYLDAGAPVFHVSAEVNIWPPPIRNYTHLYDEAGVKSVPLPNKYLNSGCFIGRAMVLKKYVQDAKEFVTTSAMSNSSWLFRQQVNYVDDQGVMSFAYLMGNPYGISLDHESAFFYSLYCATEHLVLSCGAIMYNLTSTKVGILHGNGGEGKARLEDVRGGILGDYKADLEFWFLVDGVVTRPGDVCVDVPPMVVGRPVVQCPPAGSQPEHTYTTRSVAPEDCPARGRDGKPSVPRG
ncbi:hypothetical protein Vafri_9146 [Volvox africanus]|uniref:PLOD1-3-like GT domain-containing protein n=1 Tax=Volvox africanus TaxID=51714 RepID=A0A8J4B4A8_9CHLO|nr:hypothetical protein Vafri_9146 [Volvox africanus]